MTPSKAILSTWMHVPISPSIHVPSIQRELTTKPKAFGGEDVDPIEHFDMSKEGFIGVPMDWGLERFEFEDKTSMGEPIKVSRLPDPSHPNASEGQEDFVNNIKEGLQDFRSLFAVASTGSGKTVSSLSAASQLGRTTMIVVPSVVLAEQWAEAIQNFLGVPEDKIAIIRQKKCDYKGKYFCIGVVHSIAKREYDEEFYSYFGTVIWDEAHKIGARLFSLSIHKFSACYRLALTATPTRKDGCDALIYQSFGKPRVTAIAKALEAKVLVYESTALRFRNKEGEDTSKDIPRSNLINIIVKNYSRNLEIAKLIYLMHRDGRQTLVIGDRIQHLQTLMKLVHEQGVPKPSLGLFTGSRYEGDKSVPVTSQEREDVKKHSKVIFATYGMMKEGVDIPRLDCGIDVTPRGEAVQVIGRIRRPLPNKKKPIWVTIKDVHVGAFTQSLYARIKDYKGSNCTVEDFPKNHK